MGIELTFTLELPAPAKHFLWPRRPSSIMSTLADELLNDFEDSGDENEDRGLQDDDQANGNGTNGQTHEHDNQRSATERSGARGNPTRLSDGDGVGQGKIRWTMRRQSPLLGMDLLKT